MDRGVWRATVHGVHREAGMTEQLALKGEIIQSNAFSEMILFFFFFIFKLYITVLELPNIKMNPPQVYMCSPS